MAEARALDHAGSSDLVLRALSEAVRTIATQRSLDPVLQRLVDAARALADAQYGALGVPDGEGGFSKFEVSGISEAKQRAIGDLPRTHGLLGAMLSNPTPFRVDDITADPRFQWWPDAHPKMRSLLA